MAKNPKWVLFWQFVKKCPFLLSFHSFINKITVYKLSTNGFKDATHIVRSRQKFQKTFVLNSIETTSKKGAQ